jgi:hypothetical protein
MNKVELSQEISKIINDTIHTAWDQIVMFVFIGEECRTDLYKGLNDLNEDATQKILNLIEPKEVTPTKCDGSYPTYGI